MDIQETQATSFLAKNRKQRKLIQLLITLESTDGSKELPIKPCSSYDERQTVESGGLWYDSGTNSVRGGVDSAAHRK